MSSLTRKHRFLFLLVIAVIFLTCISFYSASNNSATEQLQKQLNDDPSIIPKIRQRNRLAIDDQHIITNIYSIHSLQTKFSKYLDPICLKNILPSKALNASYPSECINLLQLMINISISLQLDSNEIDILAQRIEYLSTPNHLKKPVLYIHIPKTGGTGFGKWLEKFSKKNTVHLWVPDNMKENMFDDINYPNRYKRRRLNEYKPRIPKRANIYNPNRNRPNRNRPNRNRPNKIRLNTKNFLIKKTKMSSEPLPYPDVLYGHAAYGFDVLFLNREQLNKLGSNTLNKPDIIWRARINFTYITILRNPLTRVPSHYFYQKKGQKDENHKWTKQGFLKWISWFEEGSECLVQFISGCHHRAWYSKKYRDIWNPKLNPWPRREPDESPDIFNGMKITFDQYKIARLHLLEMGWVGLTEYLSESMEQLKVFWGIGSNQGSRKDNVNRRKPKKQIDKIIINKVKQYNKYDMELWKLGYVLYLQQQIVIKYGMGIDLQERAKNANHRGQWNIPRLRKTRMNKQNMVNRFNKLRHRVKKQHKRIGVVKK